MKNRLLHGWIMMCFLWVALICSGCSVFGVKKNAKDPNFPVVLLNHDLDRTLEISSDVDSQRDNDGLLFFQIKLRNITTSEILHLQAQTIWRDESGLPLAEDTPWTTITLTPKQEISFTQTAVLPEAKFFTVRIRYLPPVIPDAEISAE
ncbi:MAG: DUF1425 domain-containing protein [Verrucomicrobiota bacterium]